MTSICGIFGPLIPIQFEDYFTLATETPTILS